MRVDFKVVGFRILGCVPSFRDWGGVLSTCKGKVQALSGWWVFTNLLPWLSMSFSSAFSCHCI